MDMESKNVYNDGENNEYNIMEKVEIIPNEKEPEKGYYSAGEIEDIPEEKADVKQKTLSLFILFFPTLIIALIPPMDNVWLPIALKTLLAFYQLIVLKNFIDRAHGT